MSILWLLMLLWCATLTPMTKVGKDNPNWKGGKIVDPRGYVLIRVGRGHHLADVRGYAYEHRLLAEKMLGRRLRKGELVHHDNEKKGDNRRRNLIPKKSAWHHRAAHRISGRVLRLPGERNPLLVCACGCGARFRKYDKSGRLRRYLPGHNHHPAPTMEAILRILGRPMTRAELIKRVQLPRQAVAVCLSKMKRQGLVTQVKRGIWRRARG
jgi:hypothetical protein